METQRNQGDIRASKRRRVALACASCRERKVRCDGKKPVCGPCSRRPEAPTICGYNIIADSAKHLSEQEYIDSLKRQVDELKRIIVNANAPGGSSDISSGELEPLAPMRDEPNTHDGPTTGSFPGLPENASSLHPNRYSETRPGYHGGHGSGDRQPVATPAPTRVLAPLADSQQPHASLPRPAETRQTPRSDYDFQSRQANRPSPINAMGAAIQNDIPISRRASFYGQSSVVSLLQEVRRSSDQLPSTAAQVARTANQDADFTHTSSVITMVGAPYSLPPREVADRLLELYFSSFHIFYPWIHWISFHKQYEALWTATAQQASSAGKEEDVGVGGARCPRAVFFCALNAMFALGCEFSNFPEKESASATFYGRMRELLHIELFDKSSLAHVQALLLAAQYLFTTQYPNRCYNVIGFACRTAVSMGLQLSKPNYYTAVETEMRRRIWNACIQMEMTISMTLGRPPSMGLQSDVPLPRAIDDEFLQLGGGPCEQPESIISTNLFMVENVKLAHILAKILDQVYHTRSPEGSSQGTNSPPLLGHDDYGNLVQLESLLDDFKDSLPHVLDWDSGPQDRGRVNPIIERQSNVLQARFLHLKVLLYRPSFSALCAYARRNLPKLNSPKQLHCQPLGTRKQELALSFLQSCGLTCVKTAVELVESIDRATRERATGAWWFSLFYLMTCGIILIGAECAHPFLCILDQPQLDAAWDCLVQVLERIAADHASAVEYLDSLRTLRRRSLLSNHNENQAHKRSTSGTEPATAVYQATEPAPVATTGDGAVHVMNIAAGMDSARDDGIMWGGWIPGFFDNEFSIPSFLEVWEPATENQMFHTSS